MKIILLNMGTSLQTDRSDFRAAHLSGWSKNFAKGLLSNNNDFEVECWSIYDIKIYGYRGISVIEGGDSKWHYKGLQFKFFPSINIFNEPFSFELINTIKEEIKLGNKVIFHSQIMHNFMYILVSIICRNVPFVASQRGPGGPPSLMFKYSKAKISYIIKHLFEKLSNKYVDFIFCGSKGSYQNLKKTIGNEKVMLERGGGIDFSQIVKKSKKELREEINLPIDSKVIIHVGRFNHYNGLELILDIYNNLKKRDKIILLVIGGKKDQPLYTKLAASDAKVIEYMPHEKLLKYIKASDLSINLVGYRHHLLFGGMGTFIVESLSNQTPVISSTLMHFQGEKKEISELGYLPNFPFNNKEIENKILDILNNKQSFPNIRDVSKKYFSWDEVIKNHKRVYDRLVNLYYN